MFDDFNVYYIYIYNFFLCIKVMNLQVFYMLLFFLIDDKNEFKRYLYGIGEYFINYISW